MYGAIWRTLPGPRAVRALLAAVLVLAALALLWFVVFPWADHHLALYPSTVD